MSFDTFTGEGMDSGVGNSEFSDSSAMLTLDIEMQV
jgi:hypothetical protein